MKRLASIAGIQKILGKLQKLKGEPLNYDLIDEASELLVALQKSTTEDLDAAEQKQVEAFHENRIAQQVMTKEEREAVRRKAAWSQFEAVKEKMVDHSVEERTAERRKAAWDQFEAAKQAVVHQPSADATASQPISPRQRSSHSAPAVHPSTSRQSAVNIQKTLQSNPPARARTSAVSYGTTEVKPSHASRGEVSASLANRVYEAINTLMQSDELLTEIKKKRVSLGGGTKVKCNGKDYTISGDLAKTLNDLQNSNKARATPQEQMNTLVDIYERSKNWLDEKAGDRLESKGEGKKSVIDAKGSARERAEYILREPSLGSPRISKEHKLHAELFLLLDSIVNAKGSTKEVHEKSQAEITKFKDRNYGYVASWLIDLKDRQDKRGEVASPASPRLRH